MHLFQKYYLSIEGYHFNVAVIVILLKDIMRMDFSLESRIGDTIVYIFALKIPGWI